MFERARTLLTMFVCTVSNGDHMERAREHLVQYGERVGVLEHVFPERLKVFKGQLVQ